MSETTQKWTSGAEQAEAWALIGIPVTCENSTVDGHDWKAEGLAERFTTLDFSVELCTDESYRQGCIKYVPCGMDDDPSCGHRVRSKFGNAMPVKYGGSWYWVIGRVLLSSLGGK